MGVLCPGVRPGERREPRIALDVAARTAKGMRMVCEHLAALERELIAAGVEETFRGQAWSANCREWVYFACVLDLPSLRARLAFAPCVQDHVHRGTHDGAEAGFVCSACDDAVMGRHPDVAGGAAVYR